MRLRSPSLTCALVAVLCVCCTETVGGGEFTLVEPDGMSCSAGYACASDVCENGTCAPPPGGLIEIDGVCESGGTCVGDATCQDGICVQVNDDCTGGECGGSTGSGADTGFGGETGSGGFGAGGEGGSGGFGSGGDDGSGGCFEGTGGF